MNEKMNRESVMDVDLFRLNFKGVESVALSIIEIFDEQSQNFLGRISDSIEKNNPQELEIAAHSLKGAVATFHAEKCRELAFAIEKIGKSKTTAGAEKLLPELSAEVKKLSAFLQEMKKSLL